MYCSSLSFLNSMPATGLMLLLLHSPANSVLIPLARICNPCLCSVVIRAYFFGTDYKSAPSRDCNMSGSLNTLLRVLCFAFFVHCKLYLLYCHCEPDEGGRGNLYLPYIIYRFSLSSIISCSLIAFSSCLRAFSSLSLIVITPEALRTAFRPKRFLSLSIAI